MDGESGESTEDNDVIDAAGPDLRGGQTYYLRKHKKNTFGNR